jgi:hypothetical protein
MSEDLSRALERRTLRRAPGGDRGGMHGLDHELLRRELGRVRYALAA